MPAIFIAITILIAKLVPFAGSVAVLLTRALLGSLVGSSGHNAPAYLGIVALLVAYLPGAIVAYLFIHFYRLKAKLPKPTPGLIFLLFGIVLAIAEHVALVLPGVVSGLLRSNMAPQLVRMAAWLSLPFLVVGLVIVLLAARGTINPSRAETKEPQSEANAEANANL